MTEKKTSLSEAAKSASTHLERLTRAAKPAQDALAQMQERARIARDFASPGIEALSSASNAISRQLQDQFRAIDVMRDRLSDFREPSLPSLDIELLPNPIHETNERLARIEKRFDRMEKIALEGATIATSLQASAAIFLQKFETAASDTNRSSRRAILLGVIAIFIAVATPIAQGIYNEYWRAPLDAVANRKIIADLKNDLGNLRTTQIEVSDRLGAAIIKSNGDVADILKDLRTLLGKSAPAE